MGAVATASSQVSLSEQRTHQSVDIDQSHQDDLKDRTLIPKDSSANKHDMAAASFFYQQCQLMGVPLTVVNDEVR